MTTYLRVKPHGRIREKEKKRRKTSAIERKRRKTSA